MGKDAQELARADPVQDQHIEQAVVEARIGAHEHARAERRAVGDRDEHRLGLDPLPVPLDGIRDPAKRRQLAGERRQVPRPAVQAAHPHGPLVDDRVETRAQHSQPPPPGTAGPWLAPPGVDRADLARRDQRSHPGWALAWQAQRAGRVVAGPARDDGHRYAGQRADVGAEVDRAVAADDGQHVDPAAGHGVARAVLGLGSGRCGEVDDLVGALGEQAPTTRLPSGLRGPDPTSG